MRKMDEMEKEMTSESIKHSWLFGLILLFVSNTYSFLKTKVLHWSFTILLLMLIVHQLSYLFQRYKKGYKSSLFIFVVFIFAFIITIIVIYVLMK